MEKADIIVAILVALGIFSLGVMFGYFMSPLKVTFLSESNWQYLYTLDKDFYDITNKISKNEWNENYTCLNFSHDMKTELNKLGYNASVYCGWIKNNQTGNFENGHAWIELNLMFEPQTSKFIPISELEKYDKLKYCESDYFNE